jgi:hypothetical protein
MDTHHGGHAMKAIAILSFAVALQAGVLLTLAIPAPVLAKAEAAVREQVAKIARGPQHALRAAARG